MVTDYSGNITPFTMTTGQRLHYTEMLRRAREEQALIASALNCVVPRRASGIGHVLTESANATLASIARAQLLARIDPEGYGECEVCGKSISSSRLDVAPWSRRCEDHEATTLQ